MVWLSPRHWQAHMLDIRARPITSSCRFGRFRGVATLVCHPNVPDRNIASGIRAEDRTWRGLASAASLLAIAASLAGTHPGHSSTADHEFVRIRSFPECGHARLSPEGA